MSSNKQSTQKSLSQKGKTVTNKRNQKRKTARKLNVANSHMLDTLHQAATSSGEKGSSADPAPRYLQVAQQILGPAICPDNITPTPNLSRRYVVPRRYRRVVDFVAPALGKFTVAMIPNLFAPGYISDGEVHVIPDVPGNLNFRGMSLSSDVGSRLNTDGKFYNDTETLLVAAKDITDGAAVVKHGYEVVSTGATTYSLRNLSGAYQHIEIWRRETASGLWHLNATLKIAPQSTAGGSYSTISNAIAFALAAGSTTIGDKDIDININFTAAQYSAVAGSSFAPAFGKQISDLKITEGRVISMSMKITNNSAALLKAGSISIGRVPHNFSAFKDISMNMSKLPPNRVYQDAAEFGGYTFWMPEEDDEWSFDAINKKVEDYMDANYLLAHLSGLPAEASFKITFGWVVEFYTDNQNFPKVPTPIASPYWYQVQGLLVNMDAACCNPESAGMFRRFLNSGIDGVKQIQDHYGRNKETYEALMSLAKKLSLLAL